MLKLPNVMQNDDMYDKARGMRHVKQCSTKQTEEEEEDGEPLPMRPSPSPAAAAAAASAAASATASAAAASAKEGQVSPDADKAQQKVEGDHILSDRHQQVKALRPCMCINRFLGI